MAEASSASLAKKLGIKPGHRVLALNPPAGYQQTLGPLPDGASLWRWPQTAAST